MTEIFKHKFFGWIEADACRHINPDGSQGAIVAVSANIADGLTLNASIEIGPRANIGPRASIGNEARIGNDVSIGYDARIGYDASIGDDVSIESLARIGDGASIGPRARIGNGTSIGYDARIGYGADIGYGANIGYDARIGHGVSIGNGDWWLSLGPIGTERRVITVVQSAQHGLRWWVRCQHGIATEALLARIEDKHGNSPSGDDYRHLVETVLSNPARLRHAAKHGLSEGIK